jgi:hypothetical protein
MARYLNCENPRCRFILDRRMNGKLLGDPQLILKKCPECGGAWSSTCPCCAQPLTLKLIHGLPHATCSIRGCTPTQKQLSAQHGNRLSKLKWRARGDSNSRPSA